MKRSPLKSRRDTPRRKKHPIKTHWDVEKQAGNEQPDGVMLKKAPAHRRIKEKASRAATKEEKLFMGWVVLRGCSVPGCNKVANFHHEPFRSQGGHNKSGAGLCRFHHQDGKHGRHAMSRDRFNETYGIDILNIAATNWIKFKGE